MCGEIGACYPLPLMACIPISHHIEVTCQPSGRCHSEVTHARLPGKYLISHSYFLFCKSVCDTSRLRRTNIFATKHILFLDRSGTGAIQSIFVQARVLDVSLGGQCVNPCCPSVGFESAMAITECTARCRTNNMFGNREHDCKLATSHICHDNTSLSMRRNNVLSALVYTISHFPSGNECQRCNQWVNSHNT